MASIDDVARRAAGLPGVAETTTYGHRAWAVEGRAFAWERPFSKADVRRYGDDPVPGGPILAVATEDLGEKAAVITAHPGSCFTIPHLDGYAAVLVRLEAVEGSELAELLEDGWLAKAPAALAKGYLTGEK